MKGTLPSIQRVCATSLVGIALVAILLASASATPVAVGPRISTFGGATQTFPAGQPFHFSHGWTTKPNKDDSLGLWRFSLTMDGVVVPEDYIAIQQLDDPVFGHVLGRVFVFNFPNGATGTHVFAGTWTGPCAEMVSQGFATGPCPSPKAVVAAPALAATTTVTFTP